MTTVIAVLLLAAGLFSAGRIDREMQEQEQDR